MSEQVGYWAGMAQRYMAEVQELAGRLAEVHERVASLAAELSRVHMSNADLRVQVLEAEAEKAGQAARLERLSADYDEMSRRLMDLEVENERLRYGTEETPAAAEAVVPAAQPERPKPGPKPKPASATGGGFNQTCRGCSAKFRRDLHHRWYCPECAASKYGKEKVS